MSYIIVNIWLISVSLNVWAYSIRHLLCRLAKLLLTRCGLFYTQPFLQVSKSIVNMMFYSLFIPCLFCVNIFYSHSFIITSFKINDNFKSSIFLFCFFLAKNEASVSSSWICHKTQHTVVNYTLSLYLVTILHNSVLTMLQLIHVSCDI